MSVPALTTAPGTPVSGLPLDWNESYLLTTSTYLGGSAPVYTQDVDLTCPTTTPASTPSQAGAVPGPFASRGGYSRGLYVEGAGAVVFVTTAGVQDTWNVPANSFIRCAIAYIVAAGTTATGIHAGR